MTRPGLSVFRLLSPALPAAPLFCLAASLVLLSPAPARAMEGPLTFWKLSADQLEHRQGDEGEQLLSWKAGALYGSDEIALHLTSEGDYDQRQRRLETLDNRLYVSLPASEFLDARAGVRAETASGPDRWSLLLGLGGLGQQWVEFDSTLFLNDHGKASVELAGELPLALTNWLTLTPSLDATIAMADDPQMKTGAGLAKTGAGLRLSTDLYQRSFSPYVGVMQEQYWGKTANLRQAHDEDNGSLSVVTGVRLGF